MNQLAKELHAPARINYSRRSVKLLGIGDLIQLDLIILDKLKRYNKGHSCILVAIDCFTKFVFCYPLKSKADSHMAIKKFLTQDYTKIYPGVRIAHIQSDQGTEFFNKKVTQLFTKLNIIHYHTFSNLKASIVERVIRTLKGKLFERFTANGNYKWIDILKQVTDDYNNAVHSTIGMEPKSVSINNEKEVFSKIVTETRKRNKKVKQHKVLKVGTKVRISKQRGVFDKSYTPNWTAETFEIYKVRLTSTPIVYYLKDSTGNEILGGFYREELLPTKYPDVYLIERVLKRQGDRLYVKWLGYKQPSWINKNDVI